MNDRHTMTERLMTHVGHHSTVAHAVLVAMIVVAASMFTIAAKKMWSAVANGPRANVYGVWKGTVTYDWPNARYDETFVFAGDGESLRGTASFLQLDRGILKGHVDGTDVEFVTRTAQALGEQENEQRYRYRGRIAGDQIRFVLQSEGGLAERVPIEFTLYRVSGNPSDG